MKYQPCTICGSQTSSKFAVNEYLILGCGKCGHQFLSGKRSIDHVSDVYDDDYFFGGKAGYPNYLDEADLLESQGKQYSQILLRHMNPGYLLDVGCAAGFTLKGFISDGWAGVGIEPNENMANFGRNRLGLDIQTASLETIVSPRQFDVICLIQVIGHLYNLKQAISNVSNNIRPGGYCLIEYWDRLSWVARLLGKNWHEYSPPSVLHWYTKNDLDYLFSQFGFTLVDQGSPKKYIKGAHIKSLLDYKIRSLPLGDYMANGLMLIPDQLKFRYPSIDLEWILYKKSY